jgi:hypothetical protein
MLEERERYLDTLLTEREAAQMLGCSVYALRAWRSRKIGPPYYRVSTLIRYRISDLEEYLRSRQVTPSLHSKLRVSSGKEKVA